jgi:RND family efflux transporter MFP subunit
MKYIHLFTFSVVLLLASCGKKAQPANNENTEAIAVRLAVAEQVQVSDAVAGSGFISSESEARLSFKTGGIIQKIFADEGDVVHKGQLLATLNLTEINAMVTQAKEGLDKAERDAKRAANLYRDTVATLEQYQNAQTGLNVARQNYEVASFNKNYSEIRAASDGVIVRKLMNEGEVVGAGMPLFFVNATGASDWRIKVGVADRDWARLAEGDKATVEFDAFPDEQYTATVSRLSQGADPRNSLYEVELKLPKINHPLATGLFAKVNIKPGRLRTYVSVPIDAVVEGNGKDAFVFSSEGNKAKKLPVRIAYIDKDRTYIASGLAAGTKVITDGSAYLTEGTELKIVQ